MRGYFASCIVRARKNMSKEQNVSTYYNYHKPYNKVIIAPLIAPFTISLVLSFLKYSLHCPSAFQASCKNRTLHTITGSYFSCCPDQI